MNTLWQDVRFGLRVLRKSPGVTLAAVLTLGLCISVNTATFSFANVYVLRPLHFREPEQLVHVWQTNRRQGHDRIRVSLPNYRDWKRNSRSFTDLAAFNYTGENLMGADGPERISAGRVSANAFDLLGVAPMMGRVFQPGEDEAGRGRAAVLSYRFWQQRFGGDPQVLGRTMQLDDDFYTIVGVMPEDFAFPLTITQFWVPREMDPKRYPREQGLLQVVGRLKPGVTREQAQAEMAAVARQLEAEFPAENADAGVNVTPLQRELNFAYDIFQIMSLVLGVAGMLLLVIACANVASLTLSRGLGRVREIAIRTALGASRRRVVRQLLVENLIVAAAGCALGIFLAGVLLKNMTGLVPEDIYHVGSLGVDGATLAFAAGLGLVTTLLFGLAPALQTSKPDLILSLKEGASGSGTGARRQRLQSTLVVAQVTLGMMLLVGATLLARSYSVMQDVDLGYDTDSVLTMTLSLPRERYSTPELRADFHRRLLEEVRNVPGATGVATVTYLPLNHETSYAEFAVEGMPPAAGDRALSATNWWVSPEYFRVMGIRLLRGRVFDERDDAAAPHVAIVSEGLARRHFGDADPVGRRLLLTQPKGEKIAVEIVGVVANSMQTEIEEAQPEQLFRPTFQGAGSYLRLLARTERAPEQLAAGLRASVQRVDRRLPAIDLRTMREVVQEYLLPRRVMAVSVVIVALGALTLATVGLFGVLAHSVAQRMREMGIRMALGAQRADILRLVVRQGGKLAGIGIALGLAGAFALSRVMAGLIFGISSTDPLTFTMVPLLLLGVAIAACWIPARRASKVDPMVALRYE